MLRNNTTAVPRPERGWPAALLLTLSLVSPGCAPSASGQSQVAEAPLPTPMDLEAALQRIDRPRPIVQWIREHRGGETTPWEVVFEDQQAELADNNVAHNQQALSPGTPAPGRTVLYFTRATAAGVAARSSASENSLAAFCTDPTQTCFADGLASLRPDPNQWIQWALTRYEGESQDHDDNLDPSTVTITTDTASTHIDAALMDTYLTVGPENREQRAYACDYRTTEPEGAVWLSPHSVETFPGFPAIPAWVGNGRQSVSCLCGREQVSAGAFSDPCEANGSGEVICDDAGCRYYENIYFGLSYPYANGPSTVSITYYSPDHGALTTHTVPLRISTAPVSESTRVARTAEAGEATPKPSIYDCEHCPLFMSCVDNDTDGFCDAVEDGQITCSQGAPVETLGNYRPDLPTTFQRTATGKAAQFISRPTTHEGYTEQTDSAGRTYVCLEGGYDTDPGDANSYPGAFEFNDGALSGASQGQAAVVETSEGIPVVSNPLGIPTGLGHHDIPGLVVRGTLPLSGDEASVSITDNGVAIPTREVAGLATGCLPSLSLPHPDSGDGAEGGGVSQDALFVSSIFLESAGEDDAGDAPIPTARLYVVLPGPDRMGGLRPLDTIDGVPEPGIPLDSDTSPQSRTGMLRIIDRPAGEATTDFRAAMKALSGDLDGDGAIDLVLSKRIAQSSGAREFHVLFGPLDDHVNHWCQDRLSVEAGELINYEDTWCRWSPDEGSTLEFAARLDFQLPAALQPAVAPENTPRYVRFDECDLGGECGSGAPPLDGGFGINAAFGPPPPEGAPQTLFISAAADNRVYALHVSGATEPLEITASTIAAPAGVESLGRSLSVIEGDADVEGLILGHAKGYLEVSLTGDIPHAGLSYLELCPEGVGCSGSQSTAWTSGGERWAALQISSGDIVIRKAASSSTSWETVTTLSLPSSGAAATTALLSTGDIDGDGIPELVAAIPDYETTRALVSVWRHDTLAQGGAPAWTSADLLFQEREPNPTEGDTPSLPSDFTTLTSGCNLNADGGDELIVGDPAMLTPFNGSTYWTGGASIIYGASPERR